MRGGTAQLKSVGAGANEAAFVKQLLPAGRRGIEEVRVKEQAVCQGNSIVCRCDLKKTEKKRKKRVCCAAFSKSACRDPKSQTIVNQQQQHHRSSSNNNESNNKGQNYKQKILASSSLLLLLLPLPLLVILCHFLCSTSSLSLSLSSFSATTCD